MKKIENKEHDVGKEKTMSNQESKCQEDEKQMRRWRLMRRKMKIKNKFIFSGFPHKKLFLWTLSFFCSMMTRMTSIVFSAAPNQQIDFSFQPDTFYLMSQHLYIRFNLQSHENTIFVWFINTFVNKCKNANYFWLKMVIPKEPQWISPRFEDCILSPPMWPDKFNSNIWRKLMLDQ